jgi:glycosyltransferase involved in cell wall biosynthesis
MSPLLSILIPATPRRYHSHLWPLWQKLQAQVDALEREGTVELLVFLDNRQRTIGEKRDALVQMSRGEFVAFVDDDDDVAQDYIASLIGAIDKSSNDVSVITFDQNVSVNGVEAVCSFSLRHRNEPFTQPSFKRSAWHVCAWRGDLARRFRFPATNYGEDWAWARHLVVEATGEYHIDRVLHHYRYDERVSEAPPPVA